MPNAPMGIIVAYDHLSGKELFRLERPTVDSEGATLPFAGDEFRSNSRRYSVKKRFVDATDKLWKISVSDEGPIGD